MGSLIPFLRELIDIPSTTGREGELALHLERSLGERGFRVELHEIESGRYNVLARTGDQPRVVLCTHLDTVPPHFDSSEDETFVYGRGACDAKGSLAAMVLCAERMRMSGVGPLGLLFVAGEETDGIGAQVANRSPGAVDFVVVGEPTESRLASGHKGAFKFVLRAEGKAAHSAYPELGDSAVHRILDALQEIRATNWGRSDVLGGATVNVGTIAGGVASNVLAPAAEAEVFIRVVGEVGEVRERLDAILATHPCLSYETFTEKGAVRCLTLPGMEASPVAFGTDIPHLDRLGEPLLVGPGSIHDAHTPHEKIAKREARAAVDLYQRIVSTLLQRLASA